MVEVNVSAPGAQVDVTPALMVRAPSGAVAAANYGARFDGATDDADAINAAMEAVWERSRGGTVTLPRGTGIIRSSLKLPDNVELVGQGRGSTTLKLGSGANCDIIIRHPAATGLRAAVRHMTIDGSEAENTQGGVYWSGPFNLRGPALTLESVQVTACRRTAGGDNAAVVLAGSTWCVLRDVDIYLNQYVVGLWNKVADSLMDGVYCSRNGGLSGLQGAVLQRCDSTRLVGCYFGGNGGVDQVYVWGAKRLDFVSCVIDSSAGSGISFNDFSGEPSSFNRIVGGQITNASQSDGGAYDSISFRGNADGNIVSGVELANTSAPLARYAVYEEETAGADIGNLIVGCMIHGQWGSGKASLAANGNSKLLAMQGYP